MKIFKYGSVNGRFQPLHNGHLKYLLEAKKRCHFLWVGITQYNSLLLKESPKDLHRQDPINNPLTYFERSLIITKALLDNNVKLDEFSVIPFPIDTPEYLFNFLPIDVPIFTVVCDSWNQYKIDTLKHLGYKVIVLWEELKRDIIGIQIREEIRLGSIEWKNKVPHATVEIIEEYNIDERMRNSAK